MRNRFGFTLIELSIVLVIIGLIVGGVLVGRDMIKAAQIRAAISQLEQYDAAVQTFRGKYNGLPGDLLNAANFGFDTAGLQLGTVGNGVIDGDNVGAAIYGEMAFFFRHLAQAGLISDPITQSDVTLANVDVIGNVAPLSKIGRGNYIAVRSIGALNYMMIAGMSVTNSIVTFSDAITPTEAYQFDSKVDDGQATTGTVIAVTNFLTANSDESAGGPAAGECVNGTAYYTDNSTTANTNGCRLRRKAGF